MFRTCRVLGCCEAPAENGLVCSEHWEALPEELRREFIPDLFASKGCKCRAEKPLTAESFRVAVLVLEHFAGEEERRSEQWTSYLQSWKETAGALAG